MSISQNLTNNNKIFDKSNVVLYISTTLNNKHIKILKKVYENPVRSDINWNDIEKMLKGLGAEISEGSGSRVRIYLNKRIAIFHRPHPEKETNKGAVKSVREFIENSGINVGDYL